MDIAESHAYEKEGETFVFLQGKYQEFSETVNKLLQNVSREEIQEKTSEPETDQEQDYSGKTPAVTQILGETHKVNNWTELMEASR